MAQPITDYPAFFAGAKQAVTQLSELKQREEKLEEDEKQCEKLLQAKKGAVTDAVDLTVKQRTEELSASYDEEIGRAQERLKKVRAKREKAKSQGVQERIDEENAGIIKENKDLAAQMKTLFSQNHVPGYLRNGYYYALYFTKGVKETLCLFATLLVCFLIIPCGVYLLLPQRKSVYLVAIYLVAIVVFGGLYMFVGNRTKLRYMDVLKEGRAIRSKVRANRKRMKVIAKSVRKDKSESAYDLQKFDDEIAQMEQDLAQVTAKKKEALNKFDTVTKTILSDEIRSNNQEATDKLQADLDQTASALRDAQNQIKALALDLTDNYEIYVGKEFMTGERLDELESIIKSGAASNLSEAVTVYKSGDYKSVPTGETI